MVLLMVLLFLVITIGALAVVVSHDGHGSRPGPRSHEDLDLYAPTRFLR